MAQQGSVAPKERVNVVYRPATGDAKEEVELPLKVLVMGDFTLREDDRAVEDRKPINIDKDNFNDVLAGQKLQLKTAVPDTLSREPDAEMNLELDFKSIKDFTPDAIVEKVPQLKQLLELREALKAVKGPLGNVPAFKKKLSSIIDDEVAKAKLLAELGIEE
ncbi:type VI secretion system protein ImpB [Candidatus Electrothrix marina]|uniref:Type VI secretion system protein ImpB n=1 Tax=Candidatus Electrothrix marina TaxID=1859130 RepID=A0A3S3QXC4_9BACT|nr:type VI secretion system protein ImpB [Candidatus Electrothrix marina]RWX50638.1 type VI secretion system protein ImpB [Candidatus Electrothrix marina]RWX51566.1 type VI secretion system protein ImpB [Candidatus Electrothrix marina]